MSERKSAEVKFRCTPTFKAALQARAEVEGIPASQLIENAVQNHLWAARGGWRTPPVEIDDAEYGGLLEFVLTNCRATGELTAESLKAASRKVVETTVIPRDDQDPDEIPAATQEGLEKLCAPCACRPWEFCTHKVRA